MSAEELFTTLALITAGLFLVIYFFGGVKRNTKK